MIFEHAIPYPLLPDPFEDDRPLTKKEKEEKYWQENLKVTLTDEQVKEALKKWFKK